MNKKLLSACIAVVFGAGAGYALNAFAQANPKFRSSSVRRP